MYRFSLWILPLVTLLSAASHRASRIPGKDENSVKTSTFLSPPFFPRPGSVVDKFYFNIPFPRGHIALKSFDAEVVDEMGASVPLHESYLHHWVVERYYGEKATQIDSDFDKIIIARNAGVCKRTLGQYYGLGSETRRTSTWVPEPYGIVIGDPKEVPNGYEERWLLNIHAIDTRGVKDRLGCTECKCSLYNATKDQFGYPLAEGYVGGLRCCYDETQCQLRQGFNGEETRKLYLKYTVKWVEWDETVVPVKIYLFDVTDSGMKSDAATGRNCKVEYQVDSCDPEGMHNGKCVDTKTVRVVMPRGGDIIYGVAHQHSGGIGAALYAQDGRELCSSIPTYGDGEEAGNERGYIVGMSTCYPKPGSLKVTDGEILTVVSNYSSTRMHTGVMGLFYILVAEPQSQTTANFLSHALSMPWRAEVTRYWWAFVLAGGVVALIVAISFNRRHVEGYETL